MLFPIRFMGLLTRSAYSASLRSSGDVCFADLTPNSLVLDPDLRHGGTPAITRFRLASNGVLAEARVWASHIHGQRAWRIPLTASGTMARERFETGIAGVANDRSVPTTSLTGLSTTSTTSCRSGEGSASAVRCTGWLRQS